MSIEAAKQGLIADSSLAARGTIFKLSRGGTRKRVRDEAGEQLVKSQLGDQGQIASISLFNDPTSLVWQYQQKATAMYGYHSKSTFPFGRDGGGMLPPAMYFEYTTRMTNFISELGVLKDNIVANWGAVVQQDVVRRNNELSKQGKPPTAKPDDYPTVQQMEQRLYTEWYPMPVPSAANFMSGITPAMQERFTAYEEEIKRELQQEYVDRLLAPVEALVRRLDTYKGEKGQRWHASIIENVDATLQALEKMNIMGNPHLDELRRQVKEAIAPAVASGDALKEDTDKRERLKSRMEELTASMKGYKF